MSPHFKDEAWGGADLCLRIDDGVMGGILEPKLIIPPLTPASLTSGRCHTPRPPSFTPMRDPSSFPPAENHPLHLKPGPSLPSLYASKGPVCRTTQGPKSPLDSRLLLTAPQDQTIP